MTNAGGYETYGFIADLYDHVALYRDRPDIAFFVDWARNPRETPSPAVCSMFRGDGSARSGTSYRRS